MHATILPIHHLWPDEPIVFSLQALLWRLETRTDARADRGRRYSLSFILLLVILAKMCGEDTMAGIAAWAHHRRDARAAFFDRPSLTIPHATTIRRVLAALDDWDVSKRGSRSGQNARAPRGYDCLPGCMFTYWCGAYAFIPMRYTPFYGGLLWAEPCCGKIPGTPGTPFRSGGLDKGAIL